MSHYNGWLPHWIVPSDISSLQVALKSQADALNNIVTNSCTALQSGSTSTTSTSTATNPQATLSNWQGFYAKVTAYCAQSPFIYWFAPGGGTIFDQGQELQSELVAWQALLSKTCGFVQPDYTPLDPNAPTPQDPSTADALNTVRWVAAGVGAVAVAYAVSEVAMPFFAERAVRSAPRPRPRLRRRSR
jgi:hypothetical protein